MLIRRTDDWMARAGLVINGEWQPAEHYTDNAQDALTAVSKWVEKASSEEGCDSDQGWLPLISRDALCKSALLRKAELLDPKWGIVIFGNPESQRWFACCGFDDQLLNKNEWAVAEAHEDLALALGHLKVRNAQERFEWRKEMVHSTNQRDDSGNIIRHGINTARGRRRAEIGRERTKDNQAFDRTETGVKWRSKVKQQKNKPRSRSV